MGRRYSCVGVCWLCWLVVVLLSLCGVAQATFTITQSYDNINSKQYCEFTTCADALRRTRTLRLQQIAMDSVARQIKALRKHLSTTPVFAVNGIFPTRGSVFGGTKVHVCGFGFENTDTSRSGEVVENRLFCMFRLNQTKMGELGDFYGVSAATTSEFYDNEQLYGSAGIYKTASVRRLGPGQVPSFVDELTATEEFYSVFLTSPATFVNTGEIICESPDISDLPVGFPITAEVTVSINGKEQFHQANNNAPLQFTFYDQRATRDGFATVHTYKSKLGRKRLDSYEKQTEEDIEIIRRLTPDSYTGKFTGQYDEVVDEQGFL